MSVKCVLFDMDGLVIDSERLSFDIMRTYLRELGFELTLEQYFELLGKNYDFSVKYIERIYKGVDGAEFFKAYAARYVEAVRAGAQRVKAGFFELSDELKRQGIKSAIASSNLENMVRLNMETLGLSGRFDAIVYDGMAERAKPFPDLFLKAAELTDTPARDCLVLEDSFAGVRAAKAAEMRVIIVPDLREPTREIIEMCERRCDTLLGVIDYLNETQGC